MAILCSIVAAVFLIGGGLVALRIASILSGLPFAILLIFLCVSLLKGLGRESLASSRCEVEHWVRLLGYN